MLALLPVMLAVQTTLASPSRVQNILPRQSLTPTAGCVDACTPLENALSSATTLASLCTSAVINGYAECYDCLVAAGAVAQDAAQDTVDDYVSGCDDEGFTVNGATVSAGSDSGSTATSLGGGSETTSTSLGGGLETTSTSLDSGSGTSVDTAITAIDTATTAAKTTSTGSSSNTGSSSGDKSGGDTSGSGFKLNDGTRLSPGYYMGATSSFSVLCVFVLWNL
ncbi:hypothetical protein DFH07DRAFT_963921 [Mycena maculata]|uniref:Uncharacterized protein n=1 Tax=Mycena maculata TaxID=230809 RepID=A0AAD7N4D5_9AGAR|nr:hypothetical protein DFH07DRAFT_963921 [Mycena maculata]